MKGIFSPLIPKSGGGLSMEVNLIEYDGEKHVVRMCNSGKRAIFYVRISKELLKYNILPKLIERQGKNVFYDYLSGRDLTKDESLNIFKQIGAICARINNIKCKKRGDICSSFSKHLNQLLTGNYRIFTKEEMRQKKARRPNERHDKRRIRAVILKTEKNQIKKINSVLIIKTKAKVTLDAFDVSPANFRLSKGKVYFVDIGAIKPKIKGIGIAKCFFGWAKTQKQKKSFLQGYLSVSQTNFLTEDYMTLLNLHFLIQALHDRAKLGRDYKAQYKRLKGLLKEYSEKEKCLSEKKSTQSMNRQILESNSEKFLYNLK